MTVRGRIEIVRGDITSQAVDAIVNAANSSLLGGGGVDGAIHRVAGSRLLSACRALEGCPTGQARLTEAFDLPAKYVIHTVGPVWRGGSGDEAGLLASCYQASLVLARDHGCQSVAFPSISCGVYGYPMDQAADVSIRAVLTQLERHATPGLIRWVMFDEAAFEAWIDAFSRLVRPDSSP